MYFIKYLVEGQVLQGLLTYNLGLCSCCFCGLGQIREFTAQNLDSSIFSPPFNVCCSALVVIPWYLHIGWPADTGAHSGQDLACEDVRASFHNSPVIAWVLFPSSMPSNSSRSVIPACAHKRRARTDQGASASWSMSSVVSSLIASSSSATVFWELNISSRKPFMIPLQLSGAQGEHNAQNGCLYASGDEFAHGPWAQRLAIPSAIASGTRFLSLSVRIFSRNLHHSKEGHRNCKFLYQFVSILQFGKGVWWARM